MAPSYEQQRLRPAPCANGSAGAPSKHRATLFALARSLAQIPGLKWSQVSDPLYQQCPQENIGSEANWVLSERSQDAILALGLFLLESGGQCSENIVPYFIKIEKALHRVTIQATPNAFSSEIF